MIYQLRLDNHRSATPQLVELGHVEGVLPIHVDSDAQQAIAALRQGYPANVTESVRDEIVRMRGIVRV